MSINISHNVTLFPQPTNMTCWSAAATMLFGDRSVGPGTASTGPSGGLQNNYGNVQEFASSHGLTMHAPQSWTVEGLKELLQRGPLMVCGRVPSGHAFVVAGMEGDGTPGGTRLKIYDPWPPNVGNVVEVPYGNLMQQFPEATEYILHR